MADNSKIEWTDSTWNPVTGCTKVSAGCDNCYAETLHERFHGKGSFADRPVVVWVCTRHAGPHVQVILRDLDGDQSGLTLGEMAESALEHEREEHAGGD